MATEAPLVTLPAWPPRPQRTPGTETPKETPEAPEQQRGPAPHCGPPAPAQQQRPPPGPQAPAPQRSPRSAVPPPGPVAAGQGAARLLRRSSRPHRAQPGGGWRRIPRARAPTLTILPGRQHQRGPSPAPLPLWSGQHFRGRHGSVRPRPAASLPPPLSPPLSPVPAVAHRGRSVPAGDPCPG